MADSFLVYKGWSGEFEIGEFALIWHVILTVLADEDLNREPGSLVDRLSLFIEKEGLCEEWTSVTELDPVIAESEHEFALILNKAIWLVRTTFWQQKDLWPLLKYPVAAEKLASGRRIAHWSNLEAFLIELIRFALPILSPEAAHPVMDSLGWVRRGRVPN